MDKIEIIQGDITKMKVDANEQIERVIFVCFDEDNYKLLLEEKDEND